MASCSGCQVFNIDDKLVTFCKGTDFKTYVKQAINDELFWRDIFSRWNLSDSIENKLNNKLPLHVKSEVERILPGIFETKFLQFMTYQFPAHVSKEINSQMPLYLNNNHTMQQILDTHKASLKSLLEKSVTEIMDRIVTDPKYNEVVNAHLSSIDAKGIETLKEIMDNAANQLATNNATFNSKLAEMKSKMDTEMSNLRSELSNLSELKNKMEKMEKRYKKDITNLQWIIASAIIVVPVVAYILFNFK